MKKVIEKPYIIFLGFIPFILLLGYFNKSNFLNFNIHSTYFVIYHQDLTLLISIYFAVIALVYFIVIKKGKRLKNWMNFIHSIISVFGLFFLKILVDFSQTELLKPRRSYADNNLEYVNSGILILILLIIIAQFIFLINLTLSLINNKKYSIERKG